MDQITSDSKHFINKKNVDISISELFFRMVQIGKYLLSKWPIILLFAILGSLSGYYYAFRNKAIYTATTTFVLEDEKSSGGLGNLAGLASMAGVDVGGGGGIFQGDNILELYKSRRMIVETLLSEVVINNKKQLLVDRYIVFNQLLGDKGSNNVLETINFRPSGSHSTNLGFQNDRSTDSILNTIVADISMNYLKVGKPDKKLGIIKVDVKSKDEVFAKTFNEGIVKTVNDFYLRTKTKKSLQNVIIMQRKADSVRSVMNGAIFSAVAVTDATPNLNPTRQIQRIAPSQKAQFSAETNKAILSSLVQNLEMSKVALMKETPLLEVIDQPVYPLPKEKLGKLKGLVIGGLFFSLMTCTWLLLRRFLRRSNSNQ